MNENSRSARMQVALMLPHFHWNKDEMTQRVAMAAKPKVKDLPSSLEQRVVRTKKYETGHVTDLHGNLYSTQNNCELHKKE
jgi:hypothetical protein